MTSPRAATWVLLGLAGSAAFGRAAAAPAAEKARNVAPQRIQGEAPAPPASVGSVGGARAPQRVAGDAVRIEGKLYSPDALFILTRSGESFGRDAIVPHYLQLERDKPSLEYRLRADVLEAAAARDAAPTVGAPRP